MQSDHFEFMNVTGANRQTRQQVTSGDLMIYRGVTYVRQRQNRTTQKTSIAAQILPAHTTLHYRGATYQIQPPGHSRAAAAQKPAPSWLIYRGVAYQVQRMV